LGSLGGGNHFIEVLYEDTKSKNIWLMIHSGSRNIGNITANYYNKIAMKQLKLSDINGLNYLKINSEEGKNYIKDMTWNQ